MSTIVIHSSQSLTIDGENAGPVFDAMANHRLSALQVQPAFENYEASLLAQISAKEEEKAAVAGDLGASLLERDALVTEKAGLVADLAGALGAKTAAEQAAATAAAAQLAAEQALASHQLIVDQIVSAARAALAQHPDALPAALVRQLVNAAATYTDPRIIASLEAEKAAAEARAVELAAQLAALSA